MSETSRQYQFLLSFGPNGNRLTKFQDGTLTDYAYGDGDELTAAGSDSFTCDQFLNIKTKVSGGNTTTYSWDFESNLIGIDLPGTSNDDSHEYDGAGRRMRSKFNGAANWTNYVWDESNETLLAEYTLISSVYTLTAENTWGLGLISTNRSSTKRYFHFDGQGNTVALTNTSETVTDTYGYAAGGVPVASEDSGTSVNPFRWMGQVGAYDDGAMGSAGGLLLFHDQTIRPSLGILISRPASVSAGSINEPGLWGPKNCKECTVSGDLTRCGTFCVAWRWARDQGGDPPSHYLADCEDCCGQLFKRRNDIVACIAAHCHNFKNPPCKCSKDNPCANNESVWSNLRSIGLTLLITCFLIPFGYGCCRTEGGTASQVYRTDEEQDEFSRLTAPWAAMRVREVQRLSAIGRPDEKTEWLITLLIDTNLRNAQVQVTAIVGTLVDLDRGNLPFARKWMHRLIEVEPEEWHKEVLRRELRRMESSK